MARVQLIKLWRGFRKLVAFSSKDHICGQQQELVHDENHLRTNRSIVLSCVVFELFQIHVLYCAVGGWPYKNSPTIFAANTVFFFFRITTSHFSSEHIPVLGEESLLSLTHKDLVSRGLRARWSRPSGIWHMDAYGCCR